MSNELQQTEFQLLGWVGVFLNTTFGGAGEDTRHMLSPATHFDPEHVELYPDCPFTVSCVFMMPRSDPRPSLMSAQRAAQTQTPLGCVPPR